jgi:predicted transcriptional regulator
MKIKALSELELEVMNLVWENNSCSVRDVLKEISQKKELAYTTVATILLRLNEKGMVIRNDKDFAILYSPKISKEDYSKSIAGSFFNKFFQSFGDTAIASFAESIEELPKEKKKYFLDLLEKHDENK